MNLYETQDRFESDEECHRSKVCFNTWYLLIFWDWSWTMSLRAWKSPCEQSSWDPLGIPRDQFNYISGDLIHNSFKIASMWRSIEIGKSDPSQLGFYSCSSAY